MMIQGNTDERGSREYNVGLGQRRSDGVKKMLILLGARENQIESVSLGEEKPQADGHDEARGPRTAAATSSTAANIDALPRALRPRRRAAAAPARARSCSTTTKRAGASSCCASSSRRQEGHRGAPDEGRATAQSAADRTALLDLASQIEALRGEIAKMRGQLEVIANQSRPRKRAEAALPRHRHAHAQAREARAARRPPPQTSRRADRRETEPSRSGESRAYQAALDQFKLGNYPLAVAAMQGFLVTYPNSSLAPNAQYWIGMAHSGQRDYKSAIAAQRKLLSRLARQPEGARRDALASRAPRKPWATAGRAEDARRADRSATRRAAPPRARSSASPRSQSAFERRNPSAARPVCDRRGVRARLRLRRGRQQDPLLHHGRGLRLDQHGRT
jgi:TolA-binding protein